MTERSLSQGEDAEVPIIQLEQYACSSRGWYLDHGIANRRPYQQVTANGTKVMGNIRLRAILKGRGADTASILRNSTVDSCIPTAAAMRKAMNATPSAEQSRFLVVGVTLISAMVDGKTPKGTAKKRSMAGVDPPSREHLAPVMYGENSKLLYVVTPIQPGLSYLHLGVLLEPDASTGVATPYECATDHVYYFAEYRSTETGSERRMLVTRDIIAQEVKKLAKKGGQKGSDSSSEERQRKRMCLPGSARPDGSVESPMNDQVAGSDDQLQRYALMTARNILDLAENNLRNTTVAAVAGLSLRKFFDISNGVDFDDDDMEDLAEEIHTIWPKLQHLDVNHLAQLRRALVSERMNVDPRSLGMFLAEAMYERRKDMLATDLEIARKAFATVQRHPDDQSRLLNEAEQ